MVYFWGVLMVPVQSTMMTGSWNFVTFCSLLGPFLEVKTERHQYFLFLKTVHNTKKAKWFTLLWLWFYHLFLWRNSYGCFSLHELSSLITPTRLIFSLPNHVCGLENKGNFDRGDGWGGGGVSMCTHSPQTNTGSTLYKVLVVSETQGMKCCCGFICLVFVPF